MMNQPLKKLMSLILALAMTMSFAAMPALAVEPAVENVAAVSVESGKIVGFAPFDIKENAITLSAANRMPEEQLVKRMPKTLDVILEDGTETAVPVQWFCTTGDYAEGRYYLYQFSPKWDESAFRLDESIDLYTEAPYISVIFVEQDDNDIAPLAVCKNYTENEIQTINFLMTQMGLNQAQACGIMANIYAECDFKPNNLQGAYEKTLGYTDDSYTAAVNKGTYTKKSFIHDSAGYGIVQWTYYTLKEELYVFAVEYAKKTNQKMDIGDMAMQLECLKYQLEGDEFKSVLKKIKSYPNTAQGAYDAAAKFCEEFERPGSLETRMKERGNYAKNLYWPEYKSFTPVLTMAPPPVFVPDENSFLKEYFFEYDGTAHEPAVDPTMTDAKNFTVVYEDNVNAGLGTVKLVDQKNKVLDSCMFLIAQRDLSNAVMALQFSGVHYTGTARNVAVTVKDTIGGKAVKLVQDKDFIVTYQNNVNIGIATATVQGIGNYKGTLSKTFKICPKMTAVSSASSKKSKKLTVKWAKNTTCKGYQIQVATDSKFTKNLKKKTVTSYKTTSYTFSSLKKKTKYYIRMRTYKKLDGVTYYSAWKVYGKTVKTK